MAAPSEIPPGINYRYIKREVTSVAPPAVDPLSPVCGDGANANGSPQKLLDRLLDFNRHVEHIAQVEAILMADMGLSKSDAGVFIRAGVDAVFGRLEDDAAYQIKSHDSVAGFWMNELQEDFDEGKYFLDRTKTVFVSFEGTSIRIRKPNHRIVPRLAMYDEVSKDIGEVQFAGERVYNLSGADVFLLPLDVPVKIRWLCRFPIAIKLQVAARVTDNKTIVVEGDQKDDRFLGKDEATLILFARCDREKEELFWKFMSASGKTPYRLTSTQFQLPSKATPLNTFFARCFADFLVDPVWKKVMKDKIQSKLQQIKRPHYLEELRVVELDLGKNLPTFGQVSEKIGIDRLGVWFEIESFELQGPIRITLATSLNLLKLTGKADKKENVPVDESKLEGEEKKRWTYSTLGDLYGGYEEDEFEEETDMPDKAKPKLMRFVETIAESKAFQYVSEIGVIRRALQDVSDTELTVTVEIELIKGRLALNIPHPPSDRLWYGFLPVPTLNSKVIPKMGEKDVKFTMVTDWLEKKLVSEFHTVLTIPNMDDITIPFANSGIDPAEYRLSKLNDLVLKLT
ncbi:putative Testis-expressed sequence 2 protein [Hypsibius exemplaris]|uniref:Testis-expressed sequence 2 protein n=1 Tax=Hypsibius exemplaris TaxID=2072580 RepID=A0A1W0XBZ8_HYPEX|nr:putative Testis-expressed sequence 2 protein [Hypsibius exemplaris]